MAQVTLDISELKRLRALEALLVFAERQRLSAGQLADIARHVANDPRVLLDSDGKLLASESVIEDAAEVLREPKPYLFTSKDAASGEAMIGPYTKEEFNKLRPERKLAVANDIEWKKRNAKG